MQDEAEKSPKKKLFGNMRNPFSKTSATAAMPVMPSKAAQVFGTSARRPNKVEVRPIKPARPFATPTKVGRSDTVASLPSKVTDPEGYAKRHHSSPSRRSRGARRASARASKQSPNAEHNEPLPQPQASVESVAPPTPPAKDTPPDHKPPQQPPSPLRRALPSYDLRHSFEIPVEKGVGLRLPEFALSPIPSRSILPEHGGESPTKFRPYAADEYAKLIDGEALHWPYPESGDWTHGSLDYHNIKHIVTSAEEQEYHEVKHYSSETHLMPRFYSPSNHSFQAVAEDETPSKNVSGTLFPASHPGESRVLLVALSALVRLFVPFTSRTSLFHTFSIVWSELSSYFSAVAFTIATQSTQLMYLECD